MRKGKLINKKVIAVCLSASLLLGSLGNINCFAADNPRSKLSIFGVISRFILAPFRHCGIRGVQPGSQDAGVVVQEGRGVTNGNQENGIADVRDTPFTYYTVRRADGDTPGEVAITGVTEDGRDLNRFNIPQEVTIDNETYTVTSIGDGAFAGCTNLESIEIPNSVTSMGYWAFTGCISLKNIEIPNSVTSIGYRAFYACRSLREIVIPNSVTSIDDVAFRDCTNLREITIPDSVKSIGDTAFSGCTSLERVIIQNGVKRIGTEVFIGCTSLTNIEIPDSVRSIGNWAFDNCTNLRKITIPNSVESIGDEAFRNCKRLMEVVILGNTHIAKDAFIGCKENLRVTTRPLGTGLFFGCKWRDTIDGVL